MGPPPPPPPPPLLSTSTTLPSRKWKTEDAPRRNNNPVPPSSQPTRPTVDPAALQHAAARLRKTGYNEPLRGDVENLSDGRVERADQRLSDGDRTYRAQFKQLECDRAGETILAPPTYPSQSRPIGNFHRNTDSLSHASTREAPLSTSSTLNSFTSSTLKNQSSSSPPSSTTYVSPYSTKYSYPTNFRSYHKDDDYFNNLNTTSTTTTTPTPTTNYNNNNNNTKSSSETVLEWSEPYEPKIDQPIRNAREMIHDYSTTNYVFDTPPPPPPPLSSTNNTFEQKANARNYLQNTLAKQIRDDGLTESQKLANQNQKAMNTSMTTATSNTFDVNRIVKDSYNGDEVDHLVHQMRNTLDGNYSNPSVVQYPRRDSNSKSPSSSEYRTTTSNYSQNTLTRKIMNINICVGCGKEITADQPGCNAMNQIFHVDCFKCGKCSKTLAGSSFYNIDDKPTCENCYQESLEKCTACKRPISDKLLRACGGVYHVNCFVCFSCKKSLDGVPFTLDSDNNVHCVPCFHDKFAPRCAVCSKPIIPDEGEKESLRVVAMDKSFHVDCYKCEDCGMQLSSKLDGHGCYPIDQHLLCKTCNGNRLRVASST